MTINALIDEIQAESVIDLSDADMLNFMKSALRQIATIIDYRGFLTEGTLSVAASAQSASLGSLSLGFIKERSVWYVKDGARVPIDPPQSSQYFHAIYQSVGNGKPNYYLIQGTTITFDKPLDEALTIGINFFKEISSVVLGDTFLGDERVAQAAKHLCKAEYYGDYEEDETKANRNRDIGTALLMKIDEDYEEKEMGGNVEVREEDGL